MNDAIRLVLADKLLTLSEWLMPEERQGWAVAMRAEAEIMPNGAAALDWALGCLWAAGVERLRAGAVLVGRFVLGLLVPLLALSACYVLFGGAIRIIIEGAPATILFMVLGIWLVGRLTTPGITGAALRRRIRLSRRPPDPATDITATAQVLVSDMTATSGMRCDSTQAATGVESAYMLSGHAALLFKSGTMASEKLATCLIARSEQLLEPGRHVVRHTTLRAFASLLLGALWSALCVMTMYARLSPGMAEPLSEVGGSLLAASNMLGLAAGLFACLFVYLPLVARQQAALAHERQLLGMVRDAWLYRASGMEPQTAISVATGQSVAFRL